MTQIPTIAKLIRMIQLGSGVLNWGFEARNFNRGRDNVRRGTRPQRLKCELAHVELAQVEARRQRRGTEDRPGGIAEADDGLKSVLIGRRILNRRRHREETGILLRRKIVLNLNEHVARIGGHAGIGGYDDVAADIQADARR